jgi:FtsH-binding integral membrane protein
MKMNERKLGSGHLAAIVYGLKIIKIFVVVVAAAAAATATATATANVPGYIYTFLGLLCLAVVKEARYEMSVLYL